MKLRHFLIILAIALPMSGRGEVGLPSAVLGIDDLVEEFRGPFRNKVRELTENYVAQMRVGEVAFSSHRQLHCAHEVFGPGRIVARIRHHVEGVAPRVRETVSYHRCGDQLSLRETIVSEGPGARGSEFSEVLKGNRSLELEEGVTRRLYRMIDELGNELIRVDISREGGETKGYLHIREQRVLFFSRSLDQEMSQANFTFYPHEYSYHRQYSRWGVRRDFPQWSLRVRAHGGAAGRLVYLNGDQAVSRNEFLHQLREGAVDGALQLVKDFLSYHLHAFPPTEFASAGIQNSRMLDELRMAHVRLLSGTELNLVRNLMKNYIDAIESGKIKVQDNRPKEN